MQQENAQTKALLVLGWLAGQEDVLSGFMGASGASPAEMGARAAEPEFLASVMDFVMSDDQWVVDAAEATGQRPEDLLRVRAFLPGGDLPNWT